MNQVANADSFVDEEEKEWMETCEETTDDVFCLSTSFLIVLMLQYLIRGKAENYESGEYGDVTQSHANKMLAAALLSAILVAGGAVAMQSCSRSMYSSSTVSSRTAT